MVYINFYFKELKMNDNIVKGVFDSPDNDVYCKFEYDINTRPFKIFDNNKPIYLQLVDIIKLKIISKELKPGSKLSSVRDMAQEFGVNPNTMQRALSELERENLLYSQRTSGRFVTDNEDNINQLREEVAKVEILSLYNILTKLGYKKEELIELVINNLKEMS